MGSEECVIYMFSRKRARGKFSVAKLFVRAWPVKLYFFYIFIYFYICLHIFTYSYNFYIFLHIFTYFHIFLHICSLFGCTWSQTCSRGHRCVVKMGSGGLWGYRCVVIMGSGRHGGFARSVANLLVGKFHSRNCSWGCRCVVIMGSEECAI